MRCPQLVGDKATLRSWRGADASWYATARDEDVFRWTTEPRDLTEEAARAAFAHFDNVPDVYCFAIADTATGELVGNLPVKVHDGIADVAYWLAEPWRGRGYLSEALDLVVTWLRTLGVRSGSGPSG